MATDLRQIVRSLAAFYDFAGRTVVDVGGGGGQLAEFARPARRVIAIDRDASALARLAARLAESDLAGKFALVEGDFQEHRLRGDVVLFEFSLHQMADPAEALAHARELAADVVVIDHAPGSPWEWCAAEDAEVAAAWKAVERGATRRLQTVEAAQTFPDFPALEGKLALQGPESRRRIGRYRDQKPISIPMPYRLALI